MLGNFWCSSPSGAGLLNVVGKELLTTNFQNPKISDISSVDIIVVCFKIILAAIRTLNRRYRIRLLLPTQTC